MRKLAVLTAFVAALTAGALVASQRARSFELRAASPVGVASLPAHVTSPNVVVTVTVADPQSGVLDLRLSNDGRAWSPWTTPAPTALDAPIDLPWALSPGPGLKTVSVEVRDRAGSLATLEVVTLLLPSPGD